LTRPRGARLTIIRNGAIVILLVVRKAAIEEGSRQIFPGPCPIGSPARLETARALLRYGMQGATPAERGRIGAPDEKKEAG
jgi:hypothetical protein